jgi:tetratricopeptide (TPR) repeat protein
MRTALSEAIAQYPEDPQLILGRIHVEKKLALHKEILADGEKYMAAESLFPGTGPFYADRGKAFLALGELDEAEAAFAKGYELDALNVDAIRGMASVKLQRDNVEDGLRLAQKAVLVDSDDASSRTVLAMALARHGDINGAIAAMEEACAKFVPNPTPYAYLAVLRGYKHALDGDRSNEALLTIDEASETYEDLWPRQMVDVFAGVRSVESIAQFDYSGYTPDWRRSIDIGRLVYAAAFDLSQGRTIDFAALERDMLMYRDQNFVHLAPILKDWAAIVAARKQ